MSCKKINSPDVQKDEVHHSALLRHSPECVGEDWEELLDQRRRELEAFKKMPLRSMADHGKGKALDNDSQ